MATTQSIETCLQEPDNSGCIGGWAVVEVTAFFMSPSLALVNVTASFMSPSFRIACQLSC